MTNGWKYTWQGFRGYSRPTTVEFAPMTLLIGRNNVGKTSAYAPLLLLKQTLEARDPSTALLTRGSLIDVGTFADVITNHDTSCTMRFTMELDATISLDRRHSITVGGIELAFGATQDGRPVLTRSRVYDSNGRTVVTRTRESKVPDGPFNVTSTLIPDRQSVGRPLKEITQLRKAMRNEQPQGFLFSGLPSLLIPTEWRKDPSRWEKARVWFSAAYDIHNVYQTVNRALTDKLQNISYLGPVRSLPSRTYRLSPEPPSDVGRDGQFAPEVFSRTASDEQRTLVNEWLRKLGYGQLTHERLGDDFFRIMLDPPDQNGPSINLAHAGAGLSQLLPILVQGSTAPVGATLISQQPEIHLNPAQQVQVTDFLIHMLQAGRRRVVLETHSEHVLLRLRRRIAEGAIDPDDVAIYFCDVVGGRSTLERIDLSDSGEISRDAWPTGFFEEQLEDSFALAKAQHKSGRN